jgi:superfamily II DNA or RNA helicase
MNDLDQVTIDDYFREYSHFHVKKPTELPQPLHTPGQDPLPEFSDATRQQFEPQADVIAAAAKMLDETRRGMLVAEPGSGKTLLGVLTIHQHAQRSVRMGGCNGNYRAIVLCPDHLCKKWKSELGETIPGVKVTPFDFTGKGCKYLISDMTPLHDRIKGPRGRSKKPEGAEWYI